MIAATTESTTAPGRALFRWRVFQASWPTVLWLVVAARFHALQGVSGLRADAVWGLLVLASLVAWGASLARTRIRYLQKGVLVHRRGLAGMGASRVRHIFRYDVSPLLPRLADDIKQVPFVGEDGLVRFAEAPRRYQIPVSVRLEHGGEVHEEHATLVLEKRGLTRIDPGIARDAFAR